MVRQSKVGRVCFLPSLCNAGQLETARPVKRKLLTEASNADNVAEVCEHSIKLDLGPCNILLV